VEFLSVAKNMAEPVIDFGDGTVVPFEKRLRHTYERPGIYVVTLRGEDSGTGPGSFRSPLRVE
jgi:PKD repeat protein